MPPQSPLQSKTLPSQSHPPSGIALQDGYVPHGVVGKSLAQSSHVVPSPPHTPHKSNSIIPPHVPAQSFTQSLEGSLSQYIVQSSKRLFTSHKIPQASYTASPFGSPEQSSQLELSPPHTPHSSNSVSPPHIPAQSSLIQFPSQS